MWEALPNYMEGQELNGLVVADVSGSMRCMGGIPMAVSISLAMYIAERNTGIWKDKFITFSNRPEIQTIVGKTIGDRIYNLSRADWEGNTDLRAVFESVLNAGIKNDVPDAEMPKKLIIVSDLAYSEVYYDGIKPPSILEADGGKDVAIEFHSLSKTYFMTGWRIGWACGNPTLIAALAKVKSQIDSGLSLHLQRLGAYVLQNPDVNWTKKMLKSYLRAVIASAFVLLLALVGDVRPELAVLLGAVLAPAAKYIDPTETDFGVIAEKSLKEIKKVAKK
jgi:hypothetical protein